jgi:hypothetical protein
VATPRATALVEMGLIIVLTTRTVSLSLNALSLHVRVAVVAVRALNRKLSINEQRKRKTDDTDKRYLPF